MSLTTPPTTSCQAVKIGSIAACSGDRIDALEQMLSGSIEVDAVVGDYLAEMNLSWRKAEIEKEIGEGYDPFFLQTLKKASKQLTARLDAGTFPKIVVNAGALNPRQLAIATKSQLVSTLGDAAASLKVAYITGDDVMHLIKENAEDITHLTTGEKLSDWPHNPIIANAYIGQFGLVRALRRGADIVIAGRTTDAGTIQAIATWWHSWTENDYDNQALGLIAGHLIECGNYVTGGNFCGFKRLNPYFDIGFPIAEIYNDGKLVITKQPGQNGLVTVDTVRSQLLYEIQGRYYHNPDVIADLSNLDVHQEAEDRVGVSGFTGLPPSSTLKIAVQAYAGYQAEIIVYAIGLDVEEKARSFEVQTRRILQAKHRDKDAITVTFQLLGRCEQNPSSQNGSTTMIRVFAQAPTAEALSPNNFMIPVIENLCQGFPGFTPNLEYPRTSQPKPYLVYFPCLLDRAKVVMQTHFVGELESLQVPHTPSLAPGEPVKQENYEPQDPVDLTKFGSTVKIPLGYQVYARSGDKGANVNVGFFPQGNSKQEWDWLRSFLTTSKLLELLGEDAKSISRTERVEFSKIRSVHFVLFDLLGGGVTNTTRSDSLGKGIAEYLRAKVVEYPEKLFRGYDQRI